MCVVTMHGDADAAGVVHDVDVFLLQPGLNFVARSGK